MNKQHIIEEAVFDISFGSEEAARHLSQDMDDFIQHRLLPGADEIFGEFSTKGTVARIELLEVDLGDITASDFHEEMVSRFEEKLRSAMQQKLQMVSQSPSGTEGILTVQHSEFEQLQHFLETGRKRESAGSNEDEAIEELLEDALRHKGREFTEFLKASSRREAVLRRLSKQFPESTLIEVLELLAPAAHADFFAEQLRKADGALETKALGVSAIDGRRLIFEKLFGAYLGDASKVSEPEKLFREITAMLPSSSQEEEPDGAQTGKRADVAFPIKDGKPLSAVHMLSEELLRTRLEESLATGRAAGIAEAWPALLHEHTAMVREVFALRLGDASSQKRLAKGFPEPMLLELVGVLQPDEAGFIGELLQQPELRRSGEQVLLWRYTLSWLHASGTSETDRTGYIRGLVTELESAGVDRAELLRAVERTDADVVRTLDGVSGDKGVIAKGRKALLKRLKRRLSGDGTAEVVQEIEALSVHHAEDLVRLLEQWDVQASGEAWKRLTAGELRSLARFLIEWNGQGESGDFLREVERHASRAKSEAGYFRYVLQKLLKGEAIDLVDATQAMVSEMPSKAGEQTDSIREPETEALPSEKLLRTHLEEALATGHVAGIAEEWPALLRSHKAIIREVFERRLGDASLRERLAKGFPESMLLELVGVLQPDEAGFIGELLQQPELRRSGEQVLLWRYTLSWLHASGTSETDRTGYVRGLVAELEGAGVDRAELLRAVERTDADVVQALKAEVTGEVSRKKDVAAKGSKTLLKRLEHRLSGDGTDEVVQEIEELSARHAEDLARLLEQWDARSSGRELERLTVGELRALAHFLIKWNGQGGSGDFLREVERHASKAKSEAGYFRYVLLKLLKGEAVDLVEAVGSEATGLRPEKDSRSKASKKQKTTERNDTEVARTLDGVSGEMGIATQSEKELLKRLEKRLYGDGMAEVVQEIEALSASHLEQLARLLEQWDVQASGEAWKRLTIGELRSLTRFLIEWNGQGGSGDFLREVERHASRARSETGYYRYVLQNLLKGEAVDLVEAALAGETAERRDTTQALDDEAQDKAGEQTDSIREPEAKALPSKTLLRTRLEEALVTGRAAGIAEAWPALLHEHTAMVREVFALRLGDASSQKRLAKGFPEPMLLELVGVLQPDEAGFIGELLQQPELRRFEADEKQLLLWSYTLSWLHASGTSETDRTGYIRGLVTELESAGVDRAELLRAVERTDADVARTLDGVSGDKGVIAKGRKALLKRRLSGDGTAEVVQEIEALSVHHAEDLARLLEQWDVQASGEAWKRLTIGELRSLTRFLIEWNGQGESGDFLREVERHASRAKSEAGYFRYVLQKLLKGEAIDLVDATQAMVSEMPSKAGEQTDSIREPETEALPSEKLLRTHLEEALATGHVAGIAEEWPALLRSHKAIIREVFERRLGDASLRERLAKGFPESMLLELVGVLQPDEAGFIGELLQQPELRRFEADEKQLLLWSYTLSWLHASGTSETDRTGYVRGLVAELESAGVDRTEVLRAVERTDADVARTLDGVSGDKGVTAKGRKALLKRLEKRLSGDGTAEVVQEIEELSAHHAEDLARLLEQWDVQASGEAWKRLTIGELRSLTRFLIEWNGQGGSGDFLREVERHASKAKSETGYFRYVLQNLLKGEAVDLVEAALAGETAERRDTTQALDDEAQDKAGEQTDSIREPEAEALPSKTLLRTRLEESLATGRAAGIAEAWPALLHEHTAMVREVFARRLGDASSQKRLAEGFPEPMLLELVGVLQPDEAGFIGELLQQPELRRSGEQVLLWRYTLSWLHASGTSETDRTGYIRGLVTELESAGVDRAELLRAVERTDADVVRTLDGVSGDKGVIAKGRKALLKRLKRRLSGDGTAEVVQEIEALSVHHAEDLVRLLEQWDVQASGEAWERLTAGELRSLARFLIEWNGQGESGDFLREVERHASRAKSEAGYFRYVLQKLLKGEAVDLVEATESAAAELHLEAGVHEARSRSETSEEKREAAEDRDKQDKIAEEMGEIYIANAGMVLMAPYLPRLFDMLELTEAGKFKNDGAAERAIHLIQFAVNESGDSPEFLLTLNKILCGTPIEMPITRGIDPLPREKEAIEGMLMAMIQNWSIIGNTSVQGLRESFLQRSGRLLFRDEAWRLNIEQKGIDVLLDQLPWSFSIVKYPWMTWPVYVEWR